jgi:hypothetical protein
MGFQLIDFQQLSYTEYAMAINHTTTAQRAEWQKAPISQWLFESSQIAEKFILKQKMAIRLIPTNTILPTLIPLNPTAKRRCKAGRGVKPDIWK